MSTTANPTAHPAAVVTPRVHSASPSEAALRQAWRGMTAPSCPTTFEQAMAHPTWGVCIRAAARSLPVVHWPDVRGQHPRSKANGPRFHSRTPSTTTHVDIKRLAANDRDD